MKIKKTGSSRILLTVLFVLYSVLPLSVQAAAPEQFCVGGVPFGVKFFSPGIVIVGFSEIETAQGKQMPAYEAGLRVNDLITAINGEPVHTSADLVRRVEEEPILHITYQRNGCENSVEFAPPADCTDGRKKTGMWVRDTTAGIGTVTYVNPQTGEFAGLGHGICDSVSGELLPMDRGTVVQVQIAGIQKGVPGTPGELRGYFSSEKTGVLLGNTGCGVFGIFSGNPEDFLPDGEQTTPIGRREDVQEGDAVIRCTLDDGKAQEYTIRIDRLNRESRDNRSFSITVTDERLLGKTGGIVQGMSGSPILQNGRLIGAVTHVLVNDPTRGYGIFIENMLDAAA